MTTPTQGTNQGDNNVDASALGGGTAGGAAEGEQSSSAAASPVEVEIGGEKVKLDPAVAKAVKAVQLAAETSIAAAKAEAAKLATQLEALTKPEKDAAAKAALSDLETELFTHPGVAIKKIVDMAVAEATTTLTTAYNSNQAEARFWANFYDRNKDLKGFEDYCQFMMGRHYDSLKPLTVDEAINKLASLTKADLLKLRGKGGGDGGLEAEGGTEHTQTQSKPAATTPKSAGLTSVIKERAEKRRTSARGGGK